MHAATVVALVALLALSATAAPTKLELSLSSSSAKVVSETKDRKPQRGDRSLKVEAQTKQIEIETDAKDGKGEGASKFKIQMTTEGFPRIMIKQELNGGDQFFRLQFARVFTYVPTDKTLGYQNEAIKFDKRLDGAVFDPLQCSKQGELATGVVSCLMQTTDTLFAVKMTLGTTSFAKNNVTVQSTDIKIQVVLNLQTNIAANEVPALVVKTRSQSSSEQSRHAGNASITFGGNAYFTWETTFTTDQAATGTQYPVVAVSMVDVPPQGQTTTPPPRPAYHEDDGDKGDIQANDMQLRTVYTFAKEGAANVNWDPVFGQGAPSTDSSSSSPSSSSSSALSTGAIIGIAVGAACGLILVIAVAAMAVRGKKVRG